MADLRAPTLLILGAHIEWSYDSVASLTLGNSSLFVRRSGRAATAYHLRSLDADYRALRVAMPACERPLSSCPCVI